MYSVSVTVCNIASSKSITMLHVNVTVCNAAAIMLLSLCVNVVYVHMYLLLYVVLFLVEATTMLWCKGYCAHSCCHYMLLLLGINVAYIIFCLSSYVMLLLVKAPLCYGVNITVCKAAAATCCCYCM